MPIGSFDPLCENINMRALNAGLLAPLLIACGSEGPPPPSDADSDADEIDLTHEFPTVDVGAGDERVDECWSWTLGNEEMLYVSAVHVQVEGGIHHSNWTFSPDDLWRADDGVWQCSDHEFNTAIAAGYGGVLYAQSTQVDEETQQFPPGFALPIPPRSRIVGDVHILNNGDETLPTTITMELVTIPEEEVEVFLAGMALDYKALRILPHQRSEFTTTCDLRDTHERIVERPIDFRLHWVLPHYHGLGDLFRMEVAGGPEDGRVVYEISAGIGDPLGGLVDPPVDLTGADGVRITCGYTNPRDVEVGYGIGDQEMCSGLGFTDAPMMFSGSVGEVDGTPPEPVSDVDGVARFEGECSVFGYPASWTEVE